MTIVDLFYYILENHTDIIDAWDRPRHHLWCTCCDTPKAYVHPTHQRPILCPTPAPLDDAAAEEPDRQLDLPLADDLIADTDIPF
jgi:hypothetical protein